MADLTGMMQAAAGAAGGGDNLFIEDVFSCFLYTGNGSTQTITNGIDLAGKGGLVWNKDRNNANGHVLVDSAVGLTKYRKTESTAADSTTTAWIFNSNGYVVPGPFGNVDNQVSWTFRKAPKFFDIVTYTGTGANRTVAHSLGSVPGSIWVKRTDTTGDWQVYHRANTAAPETDFLILNTTAATADSNTRWNDTLPTDTVFTVGTEATVNASGGTYVAYLFAHDDGGFGDDGTENAITCGSFTTDGGAFANVNLGYEPQWVLQKRTDSTQNWHLTDSMRGATTLGSQMAQLFPSSSVVESSGTGGAHPTATGFESTGLAVSATLIFIAIRRGPMKTPTAGTEVYNGIARTGTSTNVTVTGVGFAPDLVIAKYRAGAGYPSIWGDRLRGVPRLLSSAANAAETSNGVDQITGFDAMDGIRLGDNQTTFQSYFNESGFGYINYFFRRAPGYFDEVCYTGTGANRTVAHNLGVVPELMIVKNRSQADAWAVYAGDNTDYLVLNTTAATADDNTYWNDTSPTSTVFSVGTVDNTNASTENYVAYLFASLAGVQDIGTYTGNGTSLTVTTGFQPRFILVKRTDSTGNWIVGDSARGLVAGNDPFLLLNSTNAEVTNQDWVDVSATGFTVNETAANANVSTGVYFYWVIS